MNNTRNEDGASSVEYGLIAFAIAALIVIVVFALGTVTNEMFSESCTEIATPAVGRGC